MTRNSRYYVSLFLTGAAVFVAVWVMFDPPQRVRASRDRERQAAVASVADAIMKYISVNDGDLPGELSTAKTQLWHMIGSGESGCTVVCGRAATEDACVDLSVLEGAFLPQVPVDPRRGSVEQTGYYVSKTAERHITVGSCYPEHTIQIVERRPEL